MGATDSTDLAQRVEILLPRVANLFHVEPRTIKLSIEPDWRWQASTRQAWPPEIPLLRLSAQSDDDVIAHEIAHCLVPSYWLLAAEGLAVWAGVTIGASTKHILFEGRTVDEVVLRHQTILPDLSMLAQERVGAGENLSPAIFPELKGRIAHATAGSFLGFISSHFPDVPRLISRRETREVDLPTLLFKTTGCDFLKLVDEWKTSIKIQSGSRGVSRVLGQ